MSDVDLDLTGPIDYLVIEFPADREPDGSALPHLVDLVERGTIRLLDLQFMRCEADGTIVALDIAEVGLRGSIDMGLFAEAASGILDQSDLEEAATALTPGSSGAVLVYENRWAAPFAVAMRRNGALLVASGRISVQAFLASLQAQGVLTPQEHEAEKARVLDP